MEILTSKKLPTYDRMQELKAFDDTKAGVKGLVDAGVVKIPKIFVRPHDELAQDFYKLALDLVCEDSSQFETPVVNLEGLHENNIHKHKKIVEQIRCASDGWGFFQLVNHGIPKDIMDEMIKGGRRFYEQDIEIKKQYYSRDHTKKAIYNSNFDLYETRSATWRDSFACQMFSPDMLDPQDLPETCRDIAFEYSKHVMKLADNLTELLSEAIGLEPDHLKGMGYTDFMTIVWHYYPACPEPELTMGTSKHTDPTFFTILLQDEVGGLQFLHKNHWVSFKPIPGSLIVNIGDLFQLISNNKLKSVEHRVLANRVGPRISVACFFGASSNDSTKLYGPIKELLSEGRPPIYKDILMKEYTDYYHTKKPDSGHPLNHFKL